MADIYLQSRSARYEEWGTLATRTYVDQDSLVQAYLDLQDVRFGWERDSDDFRGAVFRIISDKRLKEEQERGQIGRGMD
jgi:hypothetical protein